MQPAPTCPAPARWWLMWASLLLLHWELQLGMYCCCFFPPPGYVALWDSKAPHRPTSEKVSCCLETSPPSWLPPQDESPFLTLLSFCLLYFVLCPFEENGLPFCVPGVLRQYSEIVLWKLLSIQMIFLWICGLPVLSYSSTILGPPPILQYFKSLWRVGQGVGDESLLAKFPFNSYTIYWLCDWQWT